MKKIKKILRRYKMLNKFLAEEIINTGKKAGADFVEIFIENNAKNSINVINGKVEKALSGVDFGLGLRLIKGERVIYTFTNNLERENLLKITENASGAIGSKGEVGNLVFNEVDYTGKNNIKIMPNTVKKKDIANILIDAGNVAFGYDKLITQTSLGYMDSIQDVTIINSEGLWASDRRVRTRVAVSAVASNESEKQTGYFGPGALKGFEFFDGISINNVAKEAARSAVTMLKAGECPSGKMPVIIDNGFGGVIFHEACGHGLEAAAISKNASVFCGKIGQKIASEKVTAIDDGTIDGSWGSINVDDEGVPAQKNVLIENGILKGYMVDRYNGSLINMPPTGSSRRESYKLVPVSRMTNTYIAAGTDKKEDIISSTEYGLYAKYMGGGSVNPASGDFNFAVNEAYIIRNGKICEPVRGATLIGKGSEVLLDIDKVSDNLALAEGMCGASSGSIPVCVGQPMLRVKKITVGGRG
jgi:TldD protein